MGNLAQERGGQQLLLSTSRLRAVRCVCRVRGGGRPVEHVHPRTAIAVMLGGSFQVRSAKGEALLGAGALLLKDGGHGQDYVHVDDGGDDTLTFEYEAPLLEEMAAAHRGPLRFQRIAVPLSARSSRAVALTAAALAVPSAEALEEAALAAAACALESAGPKPRPISAGQERRVARVLRYVEGHSHRACDLQELAAVAGLSVFHFSRVFAAITGQTPRQLVIATRLQRAAAALRQSGAPITEIAYRVGFGDLSHFTHTFRRAFGQSPARYRRFPARERPRG